MELYQAYTDYNGMMDITEEIFREVAKRVNGTTKLTYGGHDIDLGEKFNRMTMVDAVKKFAGVDFDEIKDTEEARKIAKEKGVEFEERHAKGDILNLFFEEFVEKNIVEPTFITVSYTHLDVYKRQGLSRHVLSFASRFCRKAMTQLEHL